MAAIDINKFNEYVDKKLVTCREHNNGNLLIWNYTPICQFERIWDDVTMMCRGLITDRSGEIIARPFKKFFNYGEVWEERGDGINPVEAKIPEGGFSVTEKMDGSLFILCKYNNENITATRGSFYSDQAIKGTEILNNYIAEDGDVYLPGFTYLFEVLYPENRIVVDYGKNEILVLLAVIDTETGEELDINNCYHEDKVLHHGDMETFEHLFDGEQSNREGFVIRYEDGTRLKLKFDEYKRLHKIITGVNSRRIWEMLSAGDSIDELITVVPDEFYNWVMETVDGFKKEHYMIKQTALLAYEYVRDMESRKEQAAELFKTISIPVIRSCAFLLLDGRVEEVDGAIWKALKPVATVPFKEEV
jgi:RNA ligase